MTSMSTPFHKATAPVPISREETRAADSKQEVKGSPEVGIEEEEDIHTESQEHTHKEHSPQRIRVLLVDDHEVVRRGLVTVLEGEDDFEVVGQASNGSTLMTLARSLLPDIILLDIFLEAVNGLDIAQQLLRASPSSRIVIYTGYVDDDHIFRAMRVGVHGYIQKSLPLDELLSALRAVYRGERVVGEPRALTQVLS